MAQDQNLLFQLEKLLSWKKSKKFMAEKLQITEGEVDELLKELREKDSPQIETNFYESVRKVNVEKGTIESSIVVDFEPKDDLELAKLHKVNLDRYVISNYYSKLLPDGRFTSTVFSKIKTAKDYTPEDFAKFLQEYKPQHSVVKFVDIHPDKKTVDVEISLSDFHLAKKVIDGNNDIEVRKAAYMHVVQELVKNVRSVYNIHTVVLPISNDFFHTDNYQNQTTAGTPQDTIADYAQEYEHGFDLLVQAIDFLKANAEEVQVVLVQGNHDRTKSYYLAHALEVYYSKDSTIYFDRTTSLIKAVVLGNTFIGYHHGNCKLEDLPLLFATHKEYSRYFGNAVYREVHTGDKHHYMAKEVKGVRIQQMPSLSGTDRWHSDNNFVHSIRAGLALVYDNTHGKIAEFESRI
jgi:DNA repair exonuclease SbcCD nuclease subunit